MNKEGTPRRIGFDQQRFMNDMERIIEERQTTKSKVALEIGIHNSTLSHLKYDHQARPDAITLLALAVWADIDPRRYFIDTEVIEMESFPSKVVVKTTTLGRCRLANQTSGTCNCKIGQCYRGLAVAHWLEHPR